MQTKFEKYFERADFWSIVQDLRFYTTLFPHKKGCGFQSTCRLQDFGFSWVLLVPKTACERSGWDCIKVMH